MNVLVLGGESPRHKAWVRQVANTLQPHFGRVVFLDYRHWDTGEPIDIGHEVSEAAKLMENLEEYIIVAKSIGTVIALLGNARGVLHPKRCVFLGLPLGAMHRIAGVEQGMKLLPPVTVVQNDHDPLGSADEAASYIKEFGNGDISVRPARGETHDYVDFGLIEKLAVA